MLAYLSPMLDIFFYGNHEACCICLGQQLNADMLLLPLLLRKQQLKSRSNAVGS